MPKRRPPTANAAKLAGRPLKPVWLTGEAGKMWKTVTAQLEALGTLAKCDGNAVARYCEMSIRWASAAEFLRKYGESYPIKDDAGKVRCFQPFPQVAIVNKLSGELRQLERQFGLTPGARDKLNLGVRAGPQVATRNRMPPATIPLALNK